jgi:hypothetical protein
MEKDKQIEYAIYMSYNKLIILLGGLCCFGAAMVMPVEDEEDVSRGATLPAALQRPQRGEAARYPRDTVIGELGRGEALDGAYRFARELLTALVMKNQEASALNALNPPLVEGLFKGLEPVNPQKYRIGGGRVEPDGSTSFLVRFVGREQWIAGELYLRAEAETWGLDDFILEEVRDLSAGGDAYRFDFSPYERFF